MKLSTWLCCLSGFFLTITVYAFYRQPLYITLLLALLTLVLLWEAFKQCCTQTYHVTNEPDCTQTYHVTNEPETCCICLDDLISEVVITSCQHKFHKECLSTWFSYKRSCPLCSKMIITHVDQTTQSH